MFLLIEEGVNNKMFSYVEVMPSQPMPGALFVGKYVSLKETIKNPKEGQERIFTIEDMLNGSSEKYWKIIGKTQ